MYYTSTKNHKGGVNNLYVAEYYSGKYRVAVGTSLKSFDCAIKNAKINYKRKSKKIL